MQRGKNASYVHSLCSFLKPRSAELLVLLNETMWMKEQLLCSLSAQYMPTLAQYNPIIVNRPYSQVSVGGVLALVLVNKTDSPTLLRSFLKFHIWGNGARSVVRKEGRWSASCSSKQIADQCSLWSAVDWRERVADSVTPPPPSP